VLIKHKGNFTFTCTSLHERIPHARARAYIAACRVLKEQLFSGTHLTSIDMHITFAALLLYIGTNVSKYDTQDCGEARGQRFLYRLPVRTCEDFRV